MSDLIRKSVVVPIDFSRFSDLSIRAALPYVRQPQDLHCIHVVSAVKTGDVWHDPDAPARLQAAEATVQDFLKKHGFADVTVVVRAGDAGSEIVRYAEEIGAELIVIPSRGVNSAMQIFLGSVAERVIRLAACPVLVLKQPAPEAKG